MRFVWADYLGLARHVAADATARTYQSAASCRGPKLTARILRATNGTDGWTGGDQEGEGVHVRDPSGGPPACSRSHLSPRRSARKIRHREPEAHGKPRNHSPAVAGVGCVRVLAGQGQMSKA